MFCLLLLLAYANAFTFRFSSPPAQCARMRAIWQGGSPPYTLLMVPVDFMPQGTETRVIFERTVTTGNQLEFTFPFPARTRFAAIMSDSTGFGTGGTSPLLTVQSSNSSSCLSTTPSAPEFYFFLSSPTLTQCSPVHISWDTPSAPPVTVYGIIPRGQSFDLNAASRANGGRGFDWTVNVRSGTQFFFVVGDKNGSGKGGSSDVTTIRGGSSACIDASSPSQTADSGVGGTEPLPSSGTTGSGPDSSGSGSSSSTTGNGNGSGSGSGSTDGGGNTDGASGSTNGGNPGQGGTNTAGSGGGTVYGPLDPTSPAQAANENDHRQSKLGLILGLVLGLSGLGLVVGFCLLAYKRHKRQVERRDNQRARLLATSDVSEVHLPASSNFRDMPHTRPTARWPGTSLENLGSTFRTTPFVWPLTGSASGRASPDPRVVSPYLPPDHTRGQVDGISTPDNVAVGSTTARPQLENRSTSSGILRRLRSARSGLGFPFGGNSRNTSNSGYKSLADENSTPSSNMRNATTGPSSGSLSLSTPSPFVPPPIGHLPHDSNDSSGSSAMRSRIEHKSPLPPSYRQHVSNTSHGSHGSRFSASGHPLPNQNQQPQLPSSQAHQDTAAYPSDGNPFNDGLAVPISIAPGRLESTPLGPRPLAGAREDSFSGLSASLLRRPDMARLDTGGSIWEVPPTYNSLARQRGLE